MFGLANESRCFHNKETQLSDSSNMRMVSLVNCVFLPGFCCGNEMTWKKSTLFLVDFEVQDDVFPRIKTRHRACCGFLIVFFSVQLIIRVWVEPAEPVAPRIIGITAAHGVGPHVFYENYAAVMRFLSLFGHQA